MTAVLKAAEGGVNDLILMEPVKPTSENDNNQETAIVDETAVDVVMANEEIATPVVVEETKQ